MTSMNPGADARMHLLRANRDAISVILGKAAAGGLDLDEVVVIVADQRDTFGRALAEAAAHKVGFNTAKEAAQVAQRGEIPTLLVAVSLDAARALFIESHPTVADGLSRRPAPGSLRTLVIAEGSAMVVHALVNPSASFSRA